MIWVNETTHNLFFLADLHKPEVIFIGLQCGKPFFSNTRQIGEWTETSTAKMK
jgi:hypothetical protein